ncbi:MAG: DHA2 family efflux MFS transporter permease subunit [Actinomycetia bacterium]|nr:DHA2 family efflux MFS transporter permease subunit [Actinomycetes bacterium]
MLLAAFVGTASNIAIPILETEFSDAGLAKVSWVVSAFNVTQVTFMLLGGRLADRLGRRRVFLAGLIIFAVGAALSGMAPSIELVIAARVIQAMGVSAMLPSSLACVLPEFPVERHATIVSLWSSMGVLGAAMAPTVSAGLLQVSGWRAVFIAAVPIALVAFIAGRRVLSPGVVVTDPAPIDLVGVVAGTIAIGGLTFALVQGRVWGWLDPRITVTAAVALTGLVLFVHRSRTHPEPLLDLEILRIRSFSVVTIAGAVVSMSAAATWFLYPLFMIEVWDYSILQVGLAMTPGPVALIVLAPLAGRLADRHGYHELLVFGATMATMGTAWLAWRLQPDATYLRAFLPGTLSIGSGMAFMLGPANAAALRQIPPTQLASANAAYNMVRMTASALGVALMAAIIGDTPAGDRIDAFRAGWWTMVAVMSLGPILLALRYPRPSPEPVPSI